MSKIAIVNVNSFGNYYSDHILELENNVGPVKRFKVDENIGGKELAQLVGDYEYIILGTTPVVDTEFFKNQSNVKLITRHGIGFNHIDLDSATEHGIYVTIVSGYIERDAVAEQAATLLGAVSKRLVKADQMVRSNEWKKDRERLLGFQLTEKITGIVGLGNIGTRFAEIMNYGYKNEVLVYDPYITKESVDTLGYKQVALDELLTRSDYISLHCNLTEENTNIIDKVALEKMKESAILINTARGGLIDENDLYEALLNKKISGFGADVMTKEPIENSNPLLTLENVVITPHVGVYNKNCIEQMDRKVMNDIYLLENNEKPLEIVNEVKL